MPKKQGKVWCRCGIRCILPREVCYTTYNNHRKETLRLGGIAIPPYNDRDPPVSKLLWERHADRNWELARRKRASEARDARRVAADFRAASSSTHAGAENAEKLPQEDLPTQVLTSSGSDAFILQPAHGQQDIAQTELCNPPACSGPGSDTMNDEDEVTEVEEDSALVSQPTSPAHHDVVAFEESGTIPPMAAHGSQ